ncbi:transcriptional regulator GcvA [Benzoatithermus flavus]|uniref:Transcriptional regulator GcvA n=1 Tax=Benzoatithermus flavus TaxID=3108223 RepID=A0ABU8XQ46_9PROT
MQRRLPPLHALRVFEAAARHGSFAKAADELAVTPAAVSQQIRQLEADLGVALFRRLPRGLVVSEAARRALPELEKAFAHLARAVEDMRGGERAGPLVISVIPSFAARWLMPRLGGFIETYPEIEVTVRSELRSVDFAREDVDLGIRYGKGIYPGLDTRLLLTEEVFPVCAPSLLAGRHPLRRLDDLRHHTLLHDRALTGEEPSLYWRHWLRDAGVSRIDADRGPGFTDATMLMEAALRGLGVALGRSGLCADDLAAGRLVRPFTESRPADYAYYVVTPEGHAANPRVAAFLAWLEVEAAKSRLVTAGTNA